MKAIYLSILLISPALVWAAEKTPDSSFYKNAAEAGISEVEAGKLASEKATDTKVKDFAAMMVKDHTAANDKLKDIASGKGVTLPTTASVAQMASQAKLKVLSGETFDASYIKAQIKAHQETAALLKKEIASGGDAEAKAFAKTTLPVVQAHLKAIREIAASKGLSK